MNGKKFLYLNSRDEFFRVDIAKIVCFESDGNYTHIIMTNMMRATVGMNLAQMQKIISDRLREGASMFARVGKRHIINLNYVYQIAILRQVLVLSDGETFEHRINVSKEALKSLRDMYTGVLNNNGKPQTNNGTTER